MINSVGAAGIDDSTGGADAGASGRCMFHTKMPVVIPTARKSEIAHATDGRMAKPVQRRTADSRWMDRERSRSRTEARNSAQSGSEMPSSSELTYACTAASDCQVAPQRAQELR